MRAVVDPVRVLVTGGEGFLGRVVVRHLREAGYDVRAPAHGEFDLCKDQDVRGALYTSHAEIVVHLAAAVGGIAANRAHPGQFLYENAVMGLELMEEARRAGVGKFVGIGTSCEYPEHAKIPLREDAIWDGYPAPDTAPYAIAKRMLLAQGQAYRAEYNFNAIHLIPTNLYGPGDNFDLETSHVVPGLIHRFSTAMRTGAAEVQCWGTGLPIRELVHVEDAARAIVLATERYDEAEPVNIGSGQGIVIRALAEQIAALYGYRGAITWDRTRPDGAPQRVMDVSRAETFGFRAEVGLDEGLRETVEWYEAQAK